ncbi:hypothetical protein Tco_0113939, partial [Tanacetum coccineum]
MAGVTCWLLSGAGGVIISGVGKVSDGGTNGLKSASRLKSGWPGLAPCQSGIEIYGLCLLVLLMRMGDGSVESRLDYLLSAYTNILDVKESVITCSWEEVGDHDLRIVIP